MNPVIRYSSANPDMPAVCVSASDYDALVKRCAELEAAQVMPGFLANPIIDTLRAEVADLKARLLEAERGAEELVRLRAESRRLEKELLECATTAGGTPAA